MILQRGLPGLRPDCWEENELKTLETESSKERRRHKEKQIGLREATCLRVCHSHEHPR